MENWPFALVQARRYCSMSIKSQAGIGSVSRSVIGSAAGAAWPHPAPAAEPITDLDTLPMPAWDLIDIEQYRRAWTSANGQFSINLAASRGCPYRCNWCAK